LIQIHVCKLDSTARQVPCFADASTLRHRHNSFGHDPFRDNGPVSFGRHIRLSPHGSASCGGFSLQRFSVAHLSRFKYTKYKKKQLKEGERRNSRARAKYKRHKRQERIGTQRYSKEMTDVSDVLYAFVLFRNLARYDDSSISQPSPRVYNEYEYVSTLKITSRGSGSTYRINQCKIPPSFGIDNLPKARARFETN